MLTLPINKKWFDMIVKGEKKEEYRAFTSYYATRFWNALALGKDCDMEYLAEAAADGDFCYESHSSLWKREKRVGLGWK